MARGAEVTGGGPARTAGRRGLVSGVLVSLGTVALLLLCAEAAVRLSGLAPQREAFPRYQGWNGSGWVEEGTWGRGTIKRPSSLPGVEMGEYVPGARFRIVYSSNPRGYFDADGSVPARINGLGLRGRERSFEKPPGTFRIVGLGDSFTFGVGVRDEDTWLQRLETLLNLREDGRRYEVLNAGVGGYGTRDEIAALEHRWMALDPDLVLIGFYLNDAYSERTFNAYLHRNSTLFREPRGLASVSRLWDLARYRYLAGRLRRSIEEFYRSHYFGGAAGFLENPGGMTVDWGEARRALERGMALTEQRGALLALVIFPDFYELDGDYPFEGIHRFLGEQCRSLGLPCVDLLDTYRGARAADLWVHVTDHHPNEVAHSIAAEAVARFLTSPAVLPPGGAHGSEE